MALCSLHAAVLIQVESQASPSGRGKVPNVAPPLFIALCHHSSSLLCVLGWSVGCLANESPAPDMVGLLVGLRVRRAVQAPRVREGRVEGSEFIGFIACWSIAYCIACWFIAFCAGPCGTASHNAQASPKRTRLMTSHAHATWCLVSMPCLL